MKPLIIIGTDDTGNVAASFAKIDKLILIGLLETVKHNLISGEGEAKPEPLIKTATIVPINGNAKSN